MSIVNFTIPKTLLKRVNTAVKKQGFASKAEFFRMSALYFLERNEQIVSQKTPSNHQYSELLVSAIQKEIKQKYSDIHMSSVEVQLDDV